MNKPCGCVCTAKSDSHKTVFQLLPEELQKLQWSKRGHRLHTVGRLDCDTSGLLLITTDGEFSHRLTAPETHVLKVYKAELVTNGTEENRQHWINQFASGLTLPEDKKSPEIKVAPAKLEFTSTGEALVYVSEGKFHQVRRMFLAVGNEVKKLQRLSMGEFELPEDLEEGQWRFLNIK